MITTRFAHVPFAELPAEAQGLFFIFVLPTFAVFGAERPDRSEMYPLLETVWNENGFTPDLFADPEHLTVLVKAYFASLAVA